MMSAVATFGVIYSREHRPQFFTSNLYPQTFDEDFRLKGIEGSRGTLNTQPIDGMNQLHPHILSGTLVDVIRYPLYDHYPPEEFQQFVPSMLSGSIAIGIDYKSYTHDGDQFSTGIPAMLSGVITTIPINFINHTQFPEKYELNPPGILSGIIANG